MWGPWGRRGTVPPELGPLGRPGPQLSGRFMLQGGSLASRELKGTPAFFVPRSHFQHFTGPTALGVCPSSRPGARRPPQGRTGGSPVTEALTESGGAPGPQRRAEPCPLASPEFPTVSFLGRRTTRKIRGQTADGFQQNTPQGLAAKLPRQGDSARAATSRGQCHRATRCGQSCLQQEPPPAVPGLLS